MPERLERKPPILKSEALTRIAAIQHEEEQRGRIDSERGMFKEVIEGLETDKLTPEEALERARSIAEGRMDYN